MLTLLFEPRLPAPDLSVNQFTLLPLVGWGSAHLLE